MTTTITNGVATVDFARPGRANSLDEAGWRELRATFEALSANTEARVVLLIGSGKHFCAGMDVSVLTGLSAKIDPAVGGVAGQFQGFIEEIQGCITAIAECRKPVIAAIQGGCIGGGVAIAAACDARYCTAEAYFTVKEIDFGIVADIGTLQRLPDIIGSGLTLALALTGRRMSGAEALACGLVNRVFANRGDMLEHLTAMATGIGERPVGVVEGD